MFLLLVILLLIAFYFYSVKNHDYWAKRNVKHEPPVPLFGNHLQNQLGRKSIPSISVELYNKYPGEQLIGYYRGRTPELIVKDLNMIKHIMTVDFPYFYNRGAQGRDPDVEPLFMNLFHVEGDRWRLLRQRLTGAFTVAKLRAMFPLVLSCAERLQGEAGRLAARGDAYDARELMARFTTEFIGACGLGVEVDSINNEHSQFRELGKLIFTRRLRNRLLWPLWELFPELRKVLRVDDSKIEDALTSLVERIRAQRQYKPIGRHDFIDLLLELEAKGRMRGESIERAGADGAPQPVEMEMDLPCQVAQVFVFFAAGFETSSSATSYTLHMLAFNRRAQEKLQEEIDAVLARHGDRLSYDAIAEMTQLDMAFKEAMRIFPPVGVLNRTCTRRYKIPGTDVTIDPGVKVIIPVQAIQMDEQYFDNPTEFRPERFAADAERERHRYAYLPFGEGPRACIGARLGEMQSLAGLAAVLQRFSVRPAAGSALRVHVNPYSNVVQSVQGGLPLIFEFRQPRTNS